MAKGVCADGDLDVEAFLTPIPWIGLYIAAATLVCFFFMTRDFQLGWFYKKPFFPCKWFQMNALTLTLLQVATKIPVDLTAATPRAEDQLSKLTGTTLLCISLGFYMPSLGTMETVERYSNMLALSVNVITVIVCVCIQMHTGPIFAFIPEHIIIIVFMFVLLCLMWSSAVAFRGQIESSTSHYRSQMLEGTSDVNDVEELKKLLKKVHVLNYTGNPQTLLCETSHNHAYGLLCALSAIVVIEATLRTFIFKSTIPYCSGPDDYKWSILPVIVTQLATIAVGTLCIIWRWCSFIRHTEGDVPSANKTDKNDDQNDDHFYKRELEYLKLKALSFEVFGKKYYFLQGSKDFFTKLLIVAQTMLFGFSNKFIGYPIYVLKKIFGVICNCVWRSHGRDEELEDEGYVISTAGTPKIFKDWINGMAVKDLNRWTAVGTGEGTNHRAHENLISLIPEQDASTSNCEVDVRKLEGIGKELSNNFQFVDKFDPYNVSCLSVLVLSRMLKELKPSSEEFVKKALEESFEIIYYVDQKTHGDQTRLTLTKNVWAKWKNTTDDIISDAFKYGRTNSAASNPVLDQDHAREVLKYILHDSESKFVNGLENKNKDGPLARRHKVLTLMELSVLCKFILDKKPIDIFDFLETFFKRLLFFTISRLPVAILKEIEGDYPDEVCEENVREALKFFCTLESLEKEIEESGKKIEWSWQLESLPESQDNGVDPGSDFEAEPKSSVVDKQVGSSAPVSLAAWLCGRSDERV